MNKKNVTLRYYKAEFSTTSIRQNKKSLSDYLIEAFDSPTLKSAQDRLLEEKDLHNSFLLIPEFTAFTNNDIFGLLVELSNVKNPLLTLSNLKRPTIDIAELYKSIDDEGSDNQVIKNFCYFFISKNTVILQSTKNITPKDFVKYVNWLLVKNGINDVLLILKTPIMDREKSVIRQIREIQIADAQILLQKDRVASPNNGKENGVNITNRNLIKSILSVIREEGNIPDYIPDEIVKVSLKLTVDQRKWQKHTNEEKVRHALEVNCRHIPDEVVVILQDGSSIRAAELQYKKTIPIEHTFSGFPDSSQLQREIFVFIREIG